MQAAIIIEQSDWENLKATVARLEERDRQRDRDSGRVELSNRNDRYAEADADVILTVREVADRVRITEEAVRRARREGRLTGFKINEKEYGFRQSEVYRYLNRYNRNAAQRDVIQKES